MSEEIRLQKILADLGVASRRAAEELIRGGKVTVNGAVASVGSKADPARDRIALNGRFLRPPARAEKLYLMLNKPRGYITTMSDEMERKCVAELVRSIPQRVYPVGRLDRESEGLLLMTNDGAFANAMMHPSRHVPKTYRVTVRPGVSREQLMQIEQGIVIEGKRTAPAEVSVLLQEPGRVVLRIILREGRNREIRRMCEALGLETARLKRTAFGPVRLGMLAPGRWRKLAPEEVSALWAAAGMEKPAEGAGRPPKNGRGRRNP